MEENKYPIEACLSYENIQELKKKYGKIPPKQVADFIFIVIVLFFKFFFFPKKYFKVSSRTRHLTFDSKSLKNLTNPIFKLNFSKISQFKLEDVPKTPLFTFKLYHKIEKN